MRRLKFIVNGTTIKQDPSCDFTGLFPGVETDVIAEFSFSPEWSGAKKVIAFWSMLGGEYPPKVLGEDGSCKIPVEALKRVAFKVQVLRKQGGKIIPTNKLAVYQKGGTV